MPVQLNNALFLFYLLIAAPRATAQIDTSVLLPVAKIEASRISYQLTGDQVERWDSTELSLFSHQHAGELLAQEANIFVKNYGPGSISTVSTRGSSAGQTAIAWNGLLIQSPMLGLNDFSLIPLAFADEISLQYGGNSARWGSGAIGGVLSIANNNTLGEPFSVGLKIAAGSFNRWDQQLELQYGRANFSGSTTLFHSRAKNDYPYQVQPQLPAKKLTNAGLEQEGLLQELYFATKNNGTFGLHIWWQYADREVPPTTVQNHSEASQKDHVLRTALHWKKLYKKSTLQARTGVFREQIDFRDELSGIKAVSHFWTIINEVEHKWNLTENSQLLVGINQTYTKAFADEYQLPPDEIKHAAYASFQHRFKNWNFQISGRQEYLEGRSAAFVPAVSWEGQLTTWLAIKGKITRNFRQPTFNDRFWRPGGNPSLKSETGWGQELGLSLEKNHNKHQIILEITAFNRRIENWILWSIRETENFWSANNLAKVWSRGLSQRIKWGTSFNQWGIKVTGGYDLVHSTNEKAINFPKIDQGSQLIYVPEHQALLKLQVHWKNFRFSYLHRYTGPVLTTTDPLSGYDLADLKIQKSFSNTTYTGAIFLQIFNIWDKSYRVVERRPMPGRYFQIGGQFEFRKQ